MQPGLKRKTPSQHGSKLEPFPLFQINQALESNHKTNSAARAACEADPELAPGHNCCALCARVPSAIDEELLPCPTCSRVAYCCKEHMEVDGASHGRVCGLLACMAASEEVEMSPEDLEDLLLEFLASAKAEGLQQDALWREFVPEHLASLLGDGKSQEEDLAGENDKDKRPPSKRQRSSPLDDSPLKVHEAEGCQHKDTAHGDGREGSVGDEEGKVAGKSWNEDPAAWESQLHQATELALMSSYLSYPLTLARAIKDCEPLASAARQAQEEGRPLVVAVLGASGNAELQHTCVWKALEGAAGPGVPIVLQFVGLSVPADMHNKQEQLGNTITAAYYLGDYQQLADEVLGRSKPRRPSSKVAMSAAALAAQCAAAAAAANAGRFHTKDLDDDAGDEDEQLPDADLAEAEHEELGSTRDGVDGADNGMKTEAGKASAEGAHTEAGTSSRPLPTALAALPDVVVGYNCGLSCEDYNWLGTYRALRRFYAAKCAAASSGSPARAQSSQPASQGTQPATQGHKANPAEGQPTTSSASMRLPWLLTANTRLEALFDADIVSDHLWEWSTPIHPNPFTSLEPLQSGTLGNDVYRKNAWMAVYEIRGPTTAVAPVPAGRSAAWRTLRRGIKNIGRRAGHLAHHIVEAGRKLLPKIRLLWQRR